MKKWFENISISKKLTTGFFTIVAFALIIGLVGVFSMLTNIKSQNDTYNKCTLGLKYAADAQISLTELQVTSRDLCLYYDTDKDSYEKILKNQLETVNAKIEKYSETVTDDTDKANYEDMKTAYQNYANSISSLLKLADAGTTKEALFAQFNSNKGSGQAAVEKFQAITDYNSQLAAKRLNQDSSFSWLAIYIMGGIIIIAIAISLALSKTLTETIAPPVQKFAKFAEILAVGDIEVDKVIDEKDKNLKFRKDEIGTLADAFNRIVAGTITLSQETQAIASGDLTVEVSVRSEDDVLGVALNTLVKDFRELASSIVSSAEQVDAGAKQVATSSMTLSQGSTEQASSVEELSASIAEISQRVKDNAADAETAKELSRKSGAIMQDSAVDMELTSKAMDDISSTSKDIGKVIKAIDDIAFQTNILALNAAVEAARAGAAGKGFAVVADEVRNLSQKSAEAAKSTTLLIENAIGAVEKGTSLVNKTSASFSQLAAQSSEVNKLVDRISTQAQEQAAAISQISVGIEQVSAVVQMNSATSEESAAASEELSSQANYLKENAGRFKIQ